MKNQTMAAFLLLSILLSACALPGGAADEAACLQGEWEMSNADLNLMLTTLMPVPGMSIPVGIFQMTFSEDQFIYFSDGYSMRFEMPGGTMEAEVIFRTEGTFTPRDGMLNLGDLVSIQDVSTWRTVIDGEIAEVPGVTEISIPAPGSGPYTCNASTLTITSSIPAEEPFVMVFHR